jgi:hypothetical protein
MSPDLRQEIIAILACARALAIATVGEDGAPHATAVSHANDGLAVYFGCSAGSRKLPNIAQDDRVALTVTLPYGEWREIRGLSASGRAHRLMDPAEIEHAARLLLGKFPEAVAEYASDDLQGIAFVRVTPEAICVLDYRRGVGHAEVVVDAGDASTAG